MSDSFWLAVFLIGAGQAGLLWVMLLVLSKIGDLERSMNALGEMYGEVFDELFNEEVD